MNLKNILWVRNTGKILPNAPIGDNLFGMKLSGGSGEITTATGNPVSIITNKAQNAISTILSYSPKQSGSGDPSPQNIRPIDGWTEVNLGVNSETPTKTISLGGTYYGFTVDVERGVLRSDRAIAILNGTENWFLFNSVGKFYAANVTQNAIQQNPSDNLYLCNKYIFRGTGASYSADVTSDKSVYGQLSFRRVWIYDSSFTTLEELKASLAETPLQFVYPITPFELPLTPQTVTLLAGNNTLWTDGDSLSVTYKAKK